ncbi:hypothetical protein LCGC14_2480680 [marine sediment metagenome]|uniref:Uncharacterized protein n=1 Tax=marine sediment metagenome TaxID=412755 RepID=A0A0F9BVE1_9ZZZZ|nr:hypothetical protein [Candidatus Anoxychlamydiales bacterium]HEU64425.1 YggU family protein [Chlamydiota bacterium]
MIIKVKIIPKSKVNQIISFEEDTLKIRIKASPEKGKANKELIRFIAKSLSIAQNRISIVSGHTSRLKKLQIEGISKKDFTQVIVNK